MSGTGVRYLLHYLILIIQQSKFPYKIYKIIIILQIAINFNYTLN
jgi:hypothetical protein